MSDVLLLKINLTSETVLWSLLALAILVFIVYLIGTATSGGSIVKSVLSKGSAIKGEHVYYLPTASLSIKATAKVIVTKDATTGIVTGAKLAELALDTTVQIVPDTEKTYAIEYTSSSFANDELTFNISASGLLEGINLTAEDRITNIVTQLAESPKLILPGQQAAETNTASTEEAGNIITETKEYTNNFFILTKEIRDKAAERLWSINIDGTETANTTVDASFALK